MKRNLNGARGRLFGGAVVTAALLVPLAVFGGTALAHTAAAGPSAAQYQYRVQICHLTGSKKHPFHTITVSSAAVAAHVRHGDHVGACTGTETRRPHPNKGQGQGATSGTTTHGNQDNDHSNGKAKGHNK
jgi:hypothetical protein